MTTVVVIQPDDTLHVGTNGNIENLNEEIITGEETKRPLSLVACVTIDILKIVILIQLLGILHLYVLINIFVIVNGIMGLNDNIRKYLFTYGYFHIIDNVFIIFMNIHIYSHYQSRFIFFTLVPFLYNIICFVIIRKRIVQISNN